MEILVFKTNLTSKSRVRQVGPVLDIHPNIHQWNVDLHDCDKVLRVVTASIAAAEVENLLSTAGYYCEELK
ncbi:MAG: hypothetical protein V4725_00700 [Bacteroidota bacterium]|nr:hypothetical protein [Ferruginibacter sp.]